ncbi:fasciclin domain containing protein [Nitzschia inconspicua]|uniref:Fasciclin domain containing protein n=1 Tax=Nitzschia inconspicua TaxID=303405 RepID=A0A9K3Q0A4_9STRA|nr:fasciclin domain containing protein [Nitzschia inconspicua]
MRFFNTAAATFVATIFLYSLLPVDAQSVFDVISNDRQLTLLRTFLTTTPGLANKLRSSTDITIFAPTNQAFANVLSNPNVDLSPAQIAQILRYHFVPSGEFLASDISDGLQLRSAFQSERLTFQVNSTGVFVNNFSQVVQPNMMASNGVIHKIGNTPALPRTILNALSAPTRPPTTPAPVPVMQPVPAPAPAPDGLGNIVEVAVSLDGFSTLVDLVVLAELDTALATLPSVTVLAPTDEAFAALDPSLVEALTTPAYKFHLQEILLYHAFESILQGPNLLDSFSVLSPEGLFLTTLNTAEDRVQFRSPDGQSLVLNDGAANVVVADVAASNGVIHAIDAVLLPSFLQETVATVIASDTSNLSTLTSLLNQAGLVEVLSGDGPFTVFAPINEAFDVLTELPDLDTLTDILTYHVVAGMYPSTLIEDGLELTTVLGSTIRFSVTEMGVMINDNVPIETTDTVAGNGIVHKIGGILLP